MDKPMERSSRIVIQNHLDAVEPVIRYLESAAQQAGLNEKEIRRICYAVEETLQNSILFDFEPDDVEQIELEITHVASGLKVVISDHGIPRDPSVDVPKSLDELASEISFDTISRINGDTLSNVSSFILHKLLDRYTLINHGKGGRSVEMEIYACESRINEEELHVHAGSAQDREQFALIRQAQPSDAVGISRLFYKSYGYSYVYDLIYYPKRVAKAIATGALHTMLALSDRGNIIGHVTLMEPYSGAAITEWGMAISDPAFRGRKIMNRLIKAIMNSPSLAGYKGFFAHSVTNHEFTQKICAAHGFSDVALLIGYATADLSFKKIHKELRQRESTIISYKVLDLPDQASLFLPAHHSEIIHKLYRGIGIDCREIIDAPKEAAASTTELKETIISFLNIAEIVLEHAGSDVSKAVADTTKKLCFAKIDIIYLVINLQEYDAVHQVEAFEAQGYIFAGIFPGFHHKHALVLQYLNNLVFDYSIIESYTPLAAELKEYIRHCADR